MPTEAPDTLQADAASLPQEARSWPRKGRTGHGQCQRLGVRGHALPKRWVGSQGCRHLLTTPADLDGRLLTLCCLLASPLNCRQRMSHWASQTQSGQSQVSPHDVPSPPFSPFLIWPQSVRLITPVSFQSVAAGWHPSPPGVGLA